MRNYVQVQIPEKLYNVILEICKLEPGVETDRLYNGGSYRTVHIQ